MESPPSCRPAYRWLGEQRGEALFCALPTLAALVGSEDQRFNQRLRLLTTRFPTGCDGEAPLQRCRRKASQRHERRGHEHQTPMLSHGFSVAPALLVQAQRGLTVLIQSLSWPAWQRQGEEPWRLPVHPMAHQPGIGARQRRVLDADHQPDLAQPRETDRQRKGPRGLLPDRHRPRRRGREKRDQVFPRPRWSRQGEACARRLLADAAMRLQMPGLLPQAAPVLVSGAGHGHHRCREIPAVEHADAQRSLMWEGRCEPGHPKSDVRLHRLRELLQGCLCQPQGLHVFLEACPCLLGCWDGTVRAVLVDQGFPRRARCRAPRQAARHGQTARTPAVMTRDRMVRERRGVLALVVRPSHLVEETASRLAHGVIEDQARVSLRTAHRLRLLEQRRAPSVLDPILAPGRCRAAARQVGFVGALHDTAADVGPTVVAQDNQACQGMLKMAQLAPMLTEITQDSRVGGHHRSRSHHGKRQETCALSPRSGWDRA